MKTHLSLEYPQLEQINLPDRRLYRVPGGKEYPSVTTVLGAADDKTWLKAWRDRVGEAEADKISKRATLRGTALHGYCEDFLNNKKPNVQIFDIEQFAQFKQALINIDNIYGIEKALYSHQLKTAGTVDLIAEYKGELCVIDWKTSGVAKRREDISNYFVQTSFYAFCMYEMFKIYVPNLLIVMAVDGNKEPLVFLEKTKDWIPEFIKIRNHFKQLKGY